MHRHRLDFDAEEEHSYQMRTRAAFAPSISGLTSKITITKNNEPKADKYKQPFIVTEYQIKISWHNIGILTLIFILINQVRTCLSDLLYLYW